MNNVARDVLRQCFRQLLVAVGTVTFLSGIACGAAYADDDDDDDDDWSDSSSSDSSSDVEMWPPTSVGWPPLRPDGASDAGPIVVVGPVPTEAPATVLPPVNTAVALADPPIPIVIAGAGK